MFRPRSIGCCLAMAMVAFSAHADEAQDLFDQLFGDKVKAVEKTASRADDVELAGQLLAAAKDAADTPSILKIFCQQAHDLAIKDRSGYPIADEALQLLAEKVPAEAPGAMDALVLLRQRLYSSARFADKKSAGEGLIDALLAASSAHQLAGDFSPSLALLRRANSTATSIRSERRASIKAALDDALAKQKIAAQIDQLKSRLKANPKDAAAADQLMALLVREFNDPKAASKYTFLSKDEKLKTNLKLATKPDALTPAENMALADWYHSLSKTASSSGKATMLTNAQARYQQFLDSGEAKGLSKAKADLTLKAIAKELEKLGPVAQVPSASSQTINLLKLIKPDKHVIRGQWDFDGKVLKLGELDKNSMIQIPVNAQGNYEWAIKFIRKEGNYSFGPTFTVGDRSVSLYMSFRSDGENFDGLNEINKRGVQKRDNPTRRSSVIKSKVPYTLIIKVELGRDNHARITTKLNGKPYIQWSGPINALSMDGDRAFEPASFGFLGYRSLIDIHAMELKMLRGKAQILDIDHSEDD